MNNWFLLENRAINGVNEGYPHHIHVMLSIE